MTTPSTDVPTYHALLIGIDAYPAQPLHGCVNDIDAIEGLLLATNGSIEPRHVMRLASPHPYSTQQAAVPSRPAIAGNIRQALSVLGSNAVNPGDRVFIHYSGHGTRVPIATPAGVLWRDALVPVDFTELGDRGLLFDFELNALLAAIVARTRAVTLVLDCCHSAGATRDLPLSEMVPRFMAFTRGRPYLVGNDGAQALDGRGIGANVDDCHVVAACLNHELAHESPGAAGKRNGLLTRALVAALTSVAPGDRISVPWGRVWDRVRASVVTANPAQHVWMAGNIARAVFGGPPVDADVGLTVRQTGTNTYELDAGTSGGITEGGKIAVYGERPPPRFPPLASAEDIGARLPVSLVVTFAESARSTAVADGPPFQIPSGARGRLIETGTPARLRCAVVPPDPLVVESLAKSALLALVDEVHALACLRREPDGAWVLIDDIHRATLASPALCRLPSADVGLARELMEHYLRYSLPLRMATVSRDLPGALRLEVLKCPSARELTAQEEDGIGLPELGADAAFTYEASPGDRVAVRVRNTSGHQLKVAVLNAAASGKVQYLGDQSIGPAEFHVFWAANSRGRPFELNPPRNATDGIDRLVAIGTTSLGSDLHHLEVASTFADLVACGTRSKTRAFGEAKIIGAPADQWTATHTTVRCRAGSQ